MNLTSFVEFLVAISKYSGLPGIVFFLLFLTRKESNIRIVFYILAASLLADFLNFFFIRYVYPNSYIISNSWYLINYILVTWLFTSLMPEKKKIFFALGIGFALGSIISFSFYFTFLDSNTFIRTFSSLVFTVYSLFAFFDILKEGPANRLKNYPIFWVNTAIFLFSCVSLFRNLFQNYLVFSEGVSWEPYSYILLFGLVFNIVKNLLFFYAFILVKQGHPDYIYKPKLTPND